MLALSFVVRLIGETCRIMIHNYNLRRSVYNMNTIIIIVIISCIMFRVYFVCVCIIYIPNLGLGIAVPGREGE